MSPLELVNLTALMERSSGHPDIGIGLIDGPVHTAHPELAQGHLHEIGGGPGGQCARASSAACLHGTFVAGILAARRSSLAPAICPDCTLLLRPIFAETTSGHERMPSATPVELAAAIEQCIDAGARVINLSLALARPSVQGARSLDEAIARAMTRGVLVVAAAGNQGTLGSSVITRHPWVVAVTACDLGGMPMSESNLGTSIGRGGLSAPGRGVTSLGSDGAPLALEGTSVAAAFVTGAIALLWSEFPGASAAQIKLALTRSTTVRRTSVVPPLLNASAAHASLFAFQGQRQIA